jgi:hypothetical protein
MRDDLDGERHIRHPVLAGSLPADGHNGTIAYRNTTSATGGQTFGSLSTTLSSLAQADPWKNNENWGAQMASVYADLAGNPTPTPSATPTATPTVTPSPTPTPTPTTTPRRERALQRPLTSRTGRIRLAGASRGRAIRVCRTGPS